MGSDRLLEAVLQASWQASVGMVVVLALRVLAGRLISGRLLYGLWTLLLIRLLLPGSLLPKTPATLPSLPQMPVSAVRFEPAEPQVTGRLETVSQRGTARLTVAQDILREPETPVDWVGVAVGVWFAGGVAMGVYFASGSWWLNRRIRNGRIQTAGPIARMWAECCAEYSPRHSPLLVTSAAVESPVLLGLFRPRLVLPAHRLDGLSGEDWRHVFLHELSHFRRCDTWTNLLQLAALCVHWFNPLLWLCQRAIRADRELATDERALGFLGTGRRTSYGDTLLRVLSSAGTPKRLPVAIGIVESGSGMKRRLLRILNFRPARLACTLFGLGSMAGLALMAFGQETQAPSSVKNPTDAESVENPVDSFAQLQKDVLAAARTGNAEEIRRLQTVWSEREVYLNEKAGAELLETLISERNPVGFATLLDELRRGHAGKDWQPTAEQLQGLIADNRKDFIDALLARKLQLDLLGEANATATGPMHDWVQLRLEKVRSERADVEKLVKASGEGDLASMTKLLDAGVNVNCVAAEAFTPLTRASVSGRADAVRLLLARGAEVDKPKFPGWDYTPLCLAKTVEVAQLLKDAGANVNARLFGRNEHILTYAARWAPPEVVRWFLDQGVDPNAVTEEKFEPTLLFSAGRPETAEIIIASGVGVDTPNDSGQTALFGIARSVKEPAKIVEVLLKHGANPNHRDKYGNVPLMVAADAATVEALVAAGADVRARNDNGDSVLRFVGGDAKPGRDEALRKLGAVAGVGEGASLLMDTILNKDLARAKDLLSRGINPDESVMSFQQYKGSSAMSAAVMFGAFEIADEMRKAGGKDVGLLTQAAAQGDIARMKRLIHDGASVGEKTSAGATPLYFALRQGQMEAVLLLLENGANPDAADLFGWTPLTYVEFMNSQFQNPQQRMAQQLAGRTVEEEAAFYAAALPLLEARASGREQVDAAGETALTRAAAVGNSMVVPFLQKRGASLNHQRSDGLL